MQKLPPDFYQRDTVQVARDLLGKRLVHETDAGYLAVWITETEAYLGVEDKACHSYGHRRTGRTEVLYQPGGIAYIYLIYGMYYLLNAVTQPENNPCAVLIRSGEPLEECKDGIADMRFQKPYTTLTSAQKRGLLDGPGKLTKGLGITKAQNGLSLTHSNLYICEDTMLEPFTIGVSKRIGIDYAEEAAEWPLRFTVKKTI